ncbi:hypothetical protein DdX_01865 [Ditylenchus destructor]|uniref:DUF8206 domain-containing protein n=1 Tax=Ditylenchus destructor TaxID=166010 RepID=A0AAD4NGC1_9BILA|nr:hypothetical protein DdX_01865 [Ditylenchus destructor]
MPRTCLTRCVIYTYAKDPIWLIPHSFHVDGAEVCIGDQSKKKQVGSSVTDQPMAYVFMYKGRKLRIIDTPGIGDTDGLTKDSANFKAILNYIANLKELHGICILMTPNSTRLTPAFKYCINELLTYLHRDAAKNIVFVFTNARSTNYRSAGTLPLLKEMLGGIAKNRGVNIKVDKNTTYYVDNESYLYQCQLYKGIPQNEDDLEMFRVSWKRSDKETKRLLAYIFGLEPHRTMETVSLNEAKRIVLLLAKPLAMISTVIQSQIAVTKEHSEELQKLDADSAEFRDKLETQKIEQVFVESKELPFPMTVCNNDECVEFEKDSHNITTRIYKSKCHDHCYLEGVLKETHPEPALQKCYAMCHDPDGIIRCKFCQHTWQDHLHIWYDQQVKSRFVEDKDIKERIKRNENNHAIKLRAIRNANMYKQEIEDEQTKIIEITARFGSFLHHKGIQPYNDAMKAYAEMSIKDMEQVASQTGDYRKVDGLKVCLSEYMEQKRVLDSWLKSGREKMEPGDIKHHFNTLINLKHYGGEIEKLFKQEENSQRNQMRYTENEFSNKRALKATRNVNKQVSASFGFQSGIGALAENGAGYGFGVSNIVGHLSNAFLYGHNSSVTNQQPTCFSNFQPLSLEESYSNETDKDLSDQKGKGSSESNAKSELKPAKQSKKWFQFKGLW